MSKGISLHLGLNVLNHNSGHYPIGWDGTLKSCRNDALAMKKISSHLGYETNILLDAEASVVNVLGKIREAAKALVSGDIFLFTASCHGTRLPNQGDDAEIDRQDDAICLFDRPLLDDELAFEWSFFKEGVRILMVIDACHSGTVNNFSPTNTDNYYKSKYMPLEFSAIFFNENKKNYLEVRNNIANARRVTLACIHLLAACKEDQESLDGGSEKNNGVFTSSLVEVWANNNFTGYYDYFILQVNKRVSEKIADFNRWLSMNNKPLLKVFNPVHNVSGRVNSAFDKQKKPFNIEI